MTCDDVMQQEQSHSSVLIFSVIYRKLAPCTHNHLTFKSTVMHFIYLSVHPFLLIAYPRQYSTQDWDTAWTVFGLRQYPEESHTQSGIGICLRLILITGVQHNAPPGIKQ